MKKLVAELVTIILGVLIALGVDDWRQGREEVAVATEHLTALTAELRQNLCTVERIRGRYLPRKMDSLQTVIAFLNDPDAKVEDPAAFLDAFARSSGTSLPWLVDNEYQALQNSGNVRLVRKLQPTARVGTIYEAPQVLFSQSEGIQGRYPVVANELLPAQLQAQYSDLKSYARGEGIIAPVVADDPDLNQAIEAIRARRLELLPLARNEVGAATGRWYALTRLSYEMKLALADLKQWDQSTEPLEQSLENCRTARIFVGQEQKSETAAPAK